jgi:hypothetical protein
LQPGDLESGFANRLLILPFEGHRRAPEQSPAPGSKDPPAQLVNALRALPKRIEPGLGAVLDVPADGLVRPKPPLISIGWGDGAEGVYFAFSRELDLLEDGDKERHELSMRACENAVRIATIVAVGRGSPAVEREDIAWGISFARQSFEAACGGWEKYKREYDEFPKFCEKVHEWMLAEASPTTDGRIADSKLQRKFRGGQRHGFETDKAIQQLLKEGRIVRENRATGSRGPLSNGYRIVEE